MTLSRHLVRGGAIASLLASAGLAGCATDYPDAAPDAAEAEAARIAELERQNEALRMENQRLATAPATNSANADLPPAKPGECYARVLIPARYETVAERVITREAGEEVEVVPATWEMVDQRVLVSEASERLEVVPATYRTVTEEVVVAPARTELTEVPARYENRTERVVVKEGYTAWKKGEGVIGDSLYGGTVTDVRGTPTGEIMCLIEVPPEYRTVTRRVLVEPARTVATQIPAETRQVTKQVVATPPETRTVTVPAQYETVRIRREVTPATSRKVAIPATYRTVERQRKVTDEQLVWREVLCETNTTPDIIRRVQSALQREGYNVTVDGNLGPDTMDAIERYQRRENLGTGGLTMATVRSLGVL